MSAVVPFDLAAARIRKARGRGRCGATHPDYPDVPCQRPLGHGSKAAAHGSKGWGNGRAGILYWHDDQPARFVEDGTP